MLQLKQTITPVSLTYRIVTPMFLGGANHEAKDIRPASVKGMLRFWWRAQNWASCYRESQDNMAEALKKLHAKECRLFGHAADNDNNSGQGCFLLKVDNQELKLGKPSCTNFSPLSYMLGQGLFDRDVTRDAIMTGKFTLHILFKPSANDDERKEVLDAAKLFGLIGSLGGRSRRGWGSVVMESIGENNILNPFDVKQYSKMIEELINTDSNQLPTFSAFSAKTKFSYDITESKPINAINSVGLRLGIFRSYGRNGKTFNKTALKNFISDHDLVLNVTKGNSEHYAPKRLIFGIPHNYFFSSSSRKVNIQKTHEHKLERRASPLFVHIHPIGNEYCGLQFVLPSMFLPDHEQITMERPKGVKKDKDTKEITERWNEFSCNANFNPDWSIFDDYFKFVKTFKG